MNVQGFKEKDGSISLEFNTSSKIDGVEYLTAKDLAKHLREIKKDAVYVKDGREMIMLSPSQHAMSTEEAELEAEVLASKGRLPKKLLDKIRKLPA